MKVLVTGGAGYIGSHTCVELLDAGYELVIVDNFSNSKPEVLNRIRNITGKDFKFYEVDLLDRDGLESVFAGNEIDAVIHFAGLKAVGESVQIPLRYYHNNITGTIILCELMDKYDVKKMVFSSSATVYGMPDRVPISEDFPLRATNPYGRTKLMIEEILRDLAVTDDKWSIALLRYFNPIGAHPSGRIGEDPNGIPNNLMPYITQVASGKLKELRVFGDDYPTKDGTCIRDYIHVMDLASAHYLALEYLRKGNESDIFNLGNGNGYSVKEVIETARNVTGHPIPAEVKERRAGDPAILIASSDKAKSVLGWKPEFYSLEKIITDAWNWHKNNPNGYVE